MGTTVKAKRRHPMAAACLVVAVCLAWITSYSRASQISPSIDSTQSSLNLVLTVAGATATAQAPGSLSDSYTGSITADLTNNVLTFTGGNSIRANAAPGQNFLPHLQSSGGTNTEGSVQDYGAYESKITVIIFSTSSDIDFRDLKLDITAGSVAIGAKPNNLTFATENHSCSNYTLNIPSLGDVGNYSKELYNPVLTATDASANVVTVTKSGSSGVLTIPVDATFTTSYSGVTGTAELKGNIVCFGLTLATVALSASNATIITGGTAQLGETVANSASSGAINLNYTLGAAVGSGSATFGAVTVGSGSVAPGASQPCTVAVTSTSLGLNTISLTASDANALNTSQTANAALMVLGHANPVLRIAGGNNQTIISGGALTAVTLSLTNSGTNLSPLDVNTPSNLSGGTTGSGVVPSGGTTLFSATGFDTTTVGLNKILVTSLSAGDQQSLSGAASLALLSQNVSYSVLGHANPVYSATAALDLGSIHAGYTSAIASAGSLGVTNGNNGDPIATLYGSGSGSNSVSLTSLSGIQPGSTGAVRAVLATGTSGGTVLSQSIRYTFADDPSLAGHNSALSTGTISVAGQVYSGQMIWSGSEANGSWETQGNWNDSANVAVHAAPGLDPNFTNVDTANFSGSGSLALIDLSTANPSLASITFSGTNYTLTGGSLTLAGSASVVVSSGTQEIQSTLVLVNSASFAPAASTRLILIGNISGDEKALGLVAAGTLVLSGSNSYDGGTYVEAGTLEVTAADSLPNGSSLTIGANASSLFGASQQATPVVSDLRAVPEPGTLGLLAGGALSLIGYGWRTRTRPGSFRV
jgi:autotransporter-associated beta strand protein